MNRTPYYTHVYRPPGHESPAYPAASAAAAAAAASRLATYSLPGSAFHAAWPAGLPYPVRPAAPSAVPVRPEPERPPGAPPPQGPPGAPRQPGPPAGLHRQHAQMSAAAAAAAADQFALEQRRYKHQLQQQQQQVQQAQQAQQKQQQQVQQQRQQQQQVQQQQAQRQQQQREQQRQQQIKQQQQQQHERLQAQHQQQQAAAAAAAAAEQQRRARRPTLLPTGYHSAELTGLPRPHLSHEDPAAPHPAYRRSYGEREMGSSGGGGGGGGLSVSVSSSERRPPSGAGGDPRLPLHIVTGAEANQRESPYNPQTEAISPTLPADGLDESSLTSTKDELVGQIGTIDREIMKAESQIAKLKRKQSELEQHAARPDGSASDDEREPKMSSLPQTIYADNRKRARTAKAKLETLKGAEPAVSEAERWRLHAVQPLYNQPADCSVYSANRAAFARFKPRLVAALRRWRLSELGRERDTLNTYTVRLRQWLRRVQQHEMLPKHRQVAARDRELYEKVFPEIRRMREERERPAAGGASSSSSSGGAAAGRVVRADGAGGGGGGEPEETRPDPAQQQMSERQRLLSLAVVPPPMLDARRRRQRFINRGGLISEPLQLHDDIANLNVWTETERQTLSERYLQNPKQFHHISAALERHSTRECVRFYYLSKKQHKYKERLKKARSRGRTRGPARPPPAPLVLGADLPGMTTRGALQQRGRTAAATATSSTATTTTAQSQQQQQQQAQQQGDSRPQGDDSASAAAAENKPAAAGEEGATKAAESAGSAEDTGNSAAAGTPATCAVCQTEQPRDADGAGQWRPLPREQAPLYGLSEDTLPSGARVCPACRGRSARRRYPQVKCPISTCPTPRQRVKRLRPLPARWADADAALRQSIAAELQLTPEVVKCCTACRGRLARRLAGRPEPPAEPPWSDEELERLRTALRNGGADWTAAAAAVGSRRPAQCRRLYAQRRPELGLQRALSEHRQASDRPTPEDELTDTDTETAEESSDGDEQDTPPAAAAAPTSTAAGPTPAPAPGQPGERRGDSSATVSADEASAEPEQLKSGAARRSPPGLQNHTDHRPPVPPQAAPVSAPAPPPPHTQSAVCVISPPPAASLGPRPSIGDLIDVTINRSFRNVLARMEREGDSPAAGGDARDFTLNSLLTAGDRRAQPPPQQHHQQQHQMQQHHQMLLQQQQREQQQREQQQDENMVQDLSVKRPTGSEPPPQPARRVPPPAPPAPPRLEPPPDAYHAERRLSAPPPPASVAAGLADRRGPLPPHLTAARPPWQQPGPVPRAPAVRAPGGAPPGWPAGYPPRPEVRPLPPRSSAGGSITQGTPLASLDGLMRPPAPHLREGGSITQGTPMQPEPRRREPGPPQSEPPGPYSPRPAGVYPYPGGAGPPPGAPGDHLSSRHVLITDYITSQQMHGRRDSRGSSDGGGDPRDQLAVYGRQPPRHTPPPPRTTPPPARRQPQPPPPQPPQPPQAPPPGQQRAGVIQRPSSRPGPSRGLPPPGDPYQRLAPYAQDNFSTLVDVAVAQSSLLVPPRLERERQLQQQEQRFRQQQQQQQQQHHQQQQQQQQQQAAAAAAAVNQQRQALQHRQQQEQRMLLDRHQQQQQQQQHQQLQQQQQQLQQLQRQNTVAISKEMVAQAARAGRAAGLDKAGLTTMGLIDTIINRSMTQESRSAPPQPPPSDLRYQPPASREQPRAPPPPPERPAYSAAPPPPPDSYGYRPYRGGPGPPPQPPPARPGESAAAERARLIREEQRHLMRASPDQLGGAQRPPQSAPEQPVRGLSAPHQAWLFHHQQQHQQHQAAQQQRALEQAAAAAAATSQASRAAAVGASPLDYVKNKIAEVMRTSDKSGDEAAAAEEAAARARPPEPAPLCLTRGSNGGLAGTPPPAAHRPRPPSGRGTPSDG